VPTEGLRERWAGDGVAWNAWLAMASADSAAVIASAGFDAVTLDAQHGAASPDLAPDILAAVERAGVPAFVRLRWNDPSEIMRTLDVGARGLICPMVGSRAEAESLVRYVRYPPAGERSYGPVRGAFGAGAEQVRRANDDVLVFAMIETADGLRNVDDIATTPGLDGLYVGPADLSLGLGLSTFADLSDPDLLTALDTVLAACRRRGIVPGVHAPSPDRAARMAARGFRFVCPAADDDLLRTGATATLADVRGRLDGPAREG
jgi:4-hydroxy-2-oxoheptanedioate aldolase